MSEPRTKTMRQLCGLGYRVELFAPGNAGWRLASFLLNSVNIHYITTGMPGSFAVGSRCQWLARRPSENQDSDKESL